MAKLILSFEGTALKTFALNKDKITIGRRAENDIQVDNLAVSGEHAVITTVMNDSVIEDLGSTNGTLINGQPIQKHLLQNNDVIELGKHTLKFIVDAETAKPYTNYAKTMVMRRPDVAAPAAAPAPAAGANMGLEANTIGIRPQAARPANPDSTARMQAASPQAASTPATKPPVRNAALQILSGSGAGRVLELTKNLVTIGKPGLQVAAFSRRPTGFFVTHVEGDQFPLFNGKPLGPQAQALNDNDTIEIAGIKMSFFYKP